MVTYPKDCVENDCERKHYARGWCRYHYQRAYLSGQVNARPRHMVPEHGTLDQRLRHIGWTVTATGCWEFNGSKNDSGYGQLAAGIGRPLLASRAAWMAWRGPIPDGLLLCHKCDNPPCMNPDHLFLGDYKANMLDAKAKGRLPKWYDKLHKLTDVDVADIRAAYADGGVLQRDLAQKYGVCQQLISMIIRNERRCAERAADCTPVSVSSVG